MSKRIRSSSPLTEAEQRIGLSIAPSAKRSRIDDIINAVVYKGSNHGEQRVSKFEPSEIFGQPVIQTHFRKTPSRLSLMGLPAEIRLMVIEAAVDDLVEGIIKLRQCAWYRFSLLATSSLMRRETMEVFARKATFKVAYLKLHDWATMVGTAFIRNIRHLQIGMHLWIISQKNWILNRQIKHQPQWDFFLLYKMRCMLNPKGRITFPTDENTINKRFPHINDTAPIRDFFSPSTDNNDATVAKVLALTPLLHDGNIIRRLMVSQDGHRLKVDASEHLSLTKDELHEIFGRGVDFVLTVNGIPWEYTELARVQK